MIIFKGSGTAITTPFTADGRTIDFDSLTRLINFQIENGTQALIVSGTSGETSTTSIDEDTAILKHTIDITAKRVPVIAGTGSNDTRHALLETQIAKEVGADAAMLVTPYYNKTSQRGLLAHYHTIADAVNIPLILYNVPGRTGMTIAINTVLELAKHSNIVALKDATGDMSYSMALFAQKPADFALYCGNDDLFVPFLSMGGDGVISVVANVYPREMQAIYLAAQQGDFKQAAYIANTLFPIFSAIFADINPIGIKAALQIKGLGNGVLRLPLVSMDKEKQEALTIAMAKKQSDSLVK